MQQPRRRRWPWLLGGFALLLVVGVFWINAQLEPRRLAATVLGRAGESLQLKLSFQGTPDYAFKPEPRLVLPGFSAATLDGQVFLSAKRAEISLPWSTITGNEPVITRVQLDTPVLDVPGLKRWLASRPPTPFKLPTLNRGLAVSNGAVLDASYSLRELSLQLPHLKTGDPARLDARGRYVSGNTSLPFQLEAMLATPGLDSTLDLKLLLTPPVEATASTTPKPARRPTPISIALAGHYSWADPRFALEASKLVLVATSPLPSLEGSGHVELSDHMNLGFDAVLTRWPEAWPKLPPALAAKSERLPVHIEYQGKTDLSDALSLRAARDDTELQASVRVPELQQWLAADGASPLPPLQGTLKTPALDFDGVELQGVEVELSDGGGAEAVP